MKDQLGDNLPTIGAFRRQGMKTFPSTAARRAGVFRSSFDAAPA